MRCRNCGAELKEGLLYCEVCGEEVQIVPDYSALDDALTAHVRGEITKKQTTSEQNVTQSKQQAKKKKAPAKKKKKRNRKKKRMVMILSSMLLFLLIGIILFQNSYKGLVDRGNNALQDKHYKTAMRRFEEATRKDGKRIDAYIGISDVLIAQEKLEEAEDVLLNQKELQPDSTDVYLALVKFYMKTDQEKEVPRLLDACDFEHILTELKEYVVEPPKFSVTEGTYEEEQKLKLTSEGNDIYYTLDDFEPTKDATKFGVDIELSENEWVVKAVAYNKEGVPSLDVVQKITIELPVSDPPIVSPSSGLYESATKITIQVPDGFTAYYVFGETFPTEEKRKKYTGPISMPKGNTIFSAILVDTDTGKESAPTVRNYEYVE